MAKIKKLTDERIVLDAIYLSVAKKEVCFAGFDTRKTNLNEKTELFVKKIGREDAVKWLERYLTISSSEENRVITARLNGGIPFKGDCYEIKLTRKGKQLLGADLYLKVEFLPAKGILIVDNREQVIDDEYNLVFDFHD